MGVRGARRARPGVTGGARSTEVRSCELWLLQEAFGVPRGSSEILACSENQLCFPDEEERRGSVKGAKKRCQEVHGMRHEHRHVVGWASHIGKTKNCIYRASFVCSH